MSININPIVSKQMKSFSDEIECEVCHKYVYIDTRAKKLRCNHIICNVCAPNKRCPICEDGTLCDCLILCFA